MSNQSNMTLADQLGTIQAEIAELQSKANELKDQLIDEGEGTHEGDLFNATVVVAERKTTAWKKIAEKLEASRQMIAANTTVQDVVSVRVTARKVVR